MPSNLAHNLNPSTLTQNNPATHGHLDKKSYPFEGRAEINIGF
ncbi:hypothetical protein DSOL_1622 [Desulfosporosinus metallidurans]|uniref:Uncharacterized protein n=1 Tax=Desulfosporosinus metallidurans TaxID=1888891 RepID=A0A1Q8QZ12_9FIRM|nr:hypothetical protein DSOL_1622 [Desulfosporosinus metallidurans]